MLLLGQPLTNIFTFATIIFQVTLMCISAIVEANGLYLEPVLHAIAEQLPSLWERAQDSVTIHSSLVSGACYCPVYLLLYAKLQ